MKKWKYHNIYLMKNSSTINGLLILLNSITQQNELWRLNEVDFFNNLHDLYESRILSKSEIPPFIEKVDYITFLDVSVLLCDNTTEKLNLYCFDSNWVHVYTNDKAFMNLFTKYLCENNLGTIDYEESFE